MKILNRTNNIFELVTHEPVQEQPGDTRIAEFKNEESDLMEDKTLRLKGFILSTMK